MNKITTEIIEISPQQIKFSLNGCDVSLANALRRVMIAQVPTLAPHLVSVIQNTSVLHDQFLVQRIALIPFISETVDQFKYPWQCPCASENIEDCQVCKVHFILQKENLDSDCIEVTSLDIRPVFEALQSEEDNIRPVKPVEYFSDIEKNKKLGIPIVKLSRNQKIDLRIEVQKGIGKMHSKWSPVSLCTFQPDPQIKMDQTVELTLEQKQMLRDCCPTKVFEVQEGIFQVANPQKCIYCNQCKKTAALDAFKLANAKNLIMIGKKKDRYIFSVESIGTLPSYQIVRKAMKVLAEKLKNMEDLMA